MRIEVRRIYDGELNTFPQNYKDMVKDAVKRELKEKIFECLVPYIKDNSTFNEIKFTLEGVEQQEHAFKDGKRETITTLKFLKV